MLNGYNTVALTPAVGLRAGDFSPSCKRALTSAEAESMLFQFQSDLSIAAFRPATCGVVSSSAREPAPVWAAQRHSAQITNFTSYPIKGNLVFHPAGRSGAAGDPSLAYNLDGFTTVYYDDVINQMGQSGLGSIDVMSTTSAAPVITVRIYNDGGATAGTSGFTEDVVAPEAALRREETVLLAIPADAANFRMNVGVRTMSEGATFIVSVNDKDGFSIGSPVTKTYGPNFFEQTTAQLFFNNTPLPAGGFMRIFPTVGSAFVYGSTTDNRTNDSQIQFAARR